MKTQRIYVLVGLSIVVAAAGVAGTSLLLRSGPSAAAEAFLAQVTRGEVDAAYGTTAAEFQRDTSLFQFRRIVRRTGLDAYVSAVWSKQDVNGAQAELSGAVRSSSGQTVPVQLQLVKEGDAWRVLGFSITGVKTAPDPPTRQEVFALVDKVMSAFVDAVQIRDFTAFHRGISRAWQQEVTPRQFKDSFTQFYDDQLDLSPLGTMTPTLDPPPALGSDNAMTVEGEYPTTPSKVHFVLRFADEDGEWKLVGMKVELVAAETTPVPAEEPEKKKRHHR